MSVEAMKLALEALTDASYVDGSGTRVFAYIEETELPLFGKAIKALESALAAQGEVPAGWKLVPVQPTPEMLKAADDYHDSEHYRSEPPYGDEVTNAACYRAMLAAAPAAEPATIKQNLIVGQAADPLNLSDPAAQHVQEPVAWMYDWQADGKVVRDWVSKDCDEAHSPRSGCHNIRPLFTTPQPAPAAPNPWQALFNDVAKALNCLPSSYPDANGHVLRAAKIAAVRPTDGTPAFWYRPLAGRLYEGPIHNASIERARKDSDGWVPLYVAPGPAAPQPMTDEEIAKCVESSGLGTGRMFWPTGTTAFARAIEQHHTDRLMRGGA